MSNFNYFLIDVINFSCVDSVRVMPIEIQGLESEQYQVDTLEQTN